MRTCERASDKQQRLVGFGAQLCRAIPFAFACGGATPGPLCANLNTELAPSKGPGRAGRMGIRRRRRRRRRERERKKQRRKRRCRVSSSRIGSVWKRRATRRAGQLASVRAFLSRPLISISHPIERASASPSAAHLPALPFEQLLGPVRRRASGPQQFAGELCLLRFARYRRTVRTSRSSFQMPSSQACRPYHSRMATRIQSELNKQHEITRTTRAYATRCGDIEINTGLVLPQLVVDWS